MERAPLDQWVALIPSEDSALCYLFFPDIAPEVEEEVGDQPTSPSRMLANLREDLSAAGSGLDEAIEAGSATDEVPLAALEAEEDEVPVYDRLTSLPMEADAPREERFALDEPALAPAIRLDPSPEDDVMAPATPLVRHLRRQVGRQSARILELEEEVRRLRAVLTRG